MFYFEIIWLYKKYFGLSYVFFFNVPNSEPCFVFTNTDVKLELKIIRLIYINLQ